MHSFMDDVESDTKEHRLGSTEDYKTFLSQQQVDQFLDKQLRFCQVLQKNIESTELMDCVSGEQWKSSVAMKDLDMRYAYLEQYRIIYCNLIPLLKATILNFMQHSSTEAVAIVDQLMSKKGLKEPDHLEGILEHMKYVREVSEDDISLCKLQVQADELLVASEVPHLSYTEAYKIYQDYIKENNPNHLKVFLKSKWLNQRYAAHQPLPNDWLRFLSSSYNQPSQEIAHFSLDSVKGMLNFSVIPPGSQQPAMDKSLLFHLSNEVFMIHNRDRYFSNMLRDLYLYALAVYDSDCQYTHILPDGLDTSFSTFISQLPDTNQAFLTLEENIKTDLLFTMNKQKRLDHIRAQYDYYSQLQTLPEQDILTWLLNYEVNYQEDAVADALDEGATGNAREDITASTLHKLYGVCGISQYGGNEVFPIDLLPVIENGIVNLSKKLIKLSAEDMQVLLAVNSPQSASDDVLRAYHDRQLMIESIFSGRLDISADRHVDVCSLYHFCQYIFIHIASKEDDSLLSLFDFMAIDLLGFVKRGSFAAYDKVIQSLKNFLQCIFNLVIDVFVNVFNHEKNILLQSHVQRVDLEVVWSEVNRHIIQPFLDSLKSQSSSYNRYFSFLSDQDFSAAQRSSPSCDFSFT